MKYIDAEKLKNEIERLKQLNEVHDDRDYAQYELDVACGYDIACEEILHSITFLQQEQPEVDLEKFISNFIDKKDSENQGKWCEEDIIEAMKSSFNLGLNARKV